MLCAHDRSYAEQGNIIARIRMYIRYQYNVDQDVFVYVLRT